MSRRVPLGPPIWGYITRPHSTPSTTALLCVQGPGGIGAQCLGCTPLASIVVLGGREIRVPLLAREAAWPRLVARGILTGVADFGSRLGGVARHWRWVAVRHG
jgi:hypothetical protein